MPTDVIPDAPAADAALGALLARNRRRARILLATVAFNVWVWGTRIYNFFATGDEHTLAFVVVHLVLSFAALVVAGVVGAIALRMLSEARGGEVAP